MGGVGIVNKVVLLDAEVFPLEIACKCGHISNQVEVTETGFRRKGETLLKDTEI